MRKEPFSDWHPSNHVSFFSNRGLRLINRPLETENLKLFDVVEFFGPPVFNQTLWPDHCVQGTWGSELHRNLRKVSQFQHRAFIVDFLLSKLVRLKCFYKGAKILRTDSQEQ